MVRSKWTDAENKILVEAVKRFGEKSWQQVASCLEGRTGQQCLHRWMKTLNPNIKRGKWTVAEDKQLSVAVNSYGSHNWVKVQQHVPGRTDVQCRERWVNILNPELRSGPWTSEEDKKLIDAVTKHGPGRWSQIATLLYPRTDNQCWRRWKSLSSTPNYTNAKSHDLKVESVIGSTYRELVSKRKMILISKKQNSNQELSAKKQKM